MTPDTDLLTELPDDYTAETILADFARAPSLGNKSSYGHNLSSVIDGANSFGFWTPADWVKMNVRESKDSFEVYALVPGLLREEVKADGDESSPYVECCYASAACCYAPAAVLLYVTAILLSLLLILLQLVCLHVYSV